MIDFNNRTLNEQIRLHAVAEYPRESCGLILSNGEYLPCENTAADPEHDFRIATKTMTQDIAAVVHSHPDGPGEPTASDMQSQIACGVPFGICVSYKDYAEPPFFWGDSLPVPPLLGRQFRHGPSGNDGCGDCYALVRDYYRQERGVTLLDFPRDNDWWRNGEDLYTAHFVEAGFRPLTAAEQPERGDVAMIVVPRSDVVNHAAIYLGEGLFLHHLYNRLSVREPVGRWQRHIVRWIRYDPASDSARLVTA